MAEHVAKPVKPLKKLNHVLLENNMSHFYRTRKIVVCSLFILALLLITWVTDTHAQHVDLNGGNILEQPVPCKHGGKVYICIAVEKDGKIYIVMGDKKGEAIIFEVIDDKAVMVWNRDSI